MTNAFTNHVPLQILTKLAPELLQLIISFLSIFDIEALRSVNRNLKGKIPVGYLNQLKHREEEAPPQISLSCPALQLPQFATRSRIQTK